MIPISHIALTKIVRVFLFAVLISPFRASGQDSDILSKEFFSARRDALRKLMEDSSAAVFFSADIKNQSNDVDYEFHQDPNFYYLTGLKEPDAVLLIFKNEIAFDDFSGNEILFLRQRNPQHERWAGKTLGTDGAKSILGIQVALSVETFSEFIIRFPDSLFKKVYFLEKSREKRDPSSGGKKEESADKTKQLFQKISSGKTITDIYSLKEMMAKLREIKTKEELDLMRKAILFTCGGIKEAMKALEPGMYEYDLEAIIEYAFKSKGAEPGFPSIIGGGENSCILHYDLNKKKLSAKDVVVCDVGAEYYGYNADITRTLPVSGKFSDQQKIIYNIVLEAQQAGIAQCKPGNDFRAPHKAATEVIQKKLMETGITKTAGGAGEYFFHGTSHYVGLDVHDVGIYGKLKPNSVITVEPGIYIPFGSDCDEKWWNIGIRIEDDVLITDTEPEVLSDCVPKKIEEIEILMKKESLFNLMKK